jgi:voltage-gated potassium channel
VVEAATTEPAQRGDELPVLVGDASDDTVLARAGIARAHGLVAAAGTDATNLVITLSARSLNDRLTIVARASGPASETKLLHAGAAYAVSPYTIGGQRIVSELLSPGMTAFLDTVLHGESLDLWLEEATLSPHSALAGRTVREAVPQTMGGLILVAIRRGSDGGFVTNPSPDIRLTAGDTIIAVGPQHALHRLATHATGTSARAAARRRRT